MYKRVCFLISRPVNVSETTPLGVNYAMRRRYGGTRSFVVVVVVVTDLRRAISRFGTETRGRTFGCTRHSRKCFAATYVDGVFTEERQWQRWRWWRLRWGIATISAPETTGTDARAPAAIVIGHDVTFASQRGPRERSHGHVCRHRYDDVGRTARIGYDETAGGGGVCF